MSGDCSMGCLAVKIRRLVSFDFFSSRASKSFVRCERRKGCHVVFANQRGWLVLRLGMTAFAEKKKPEWSHE